MSQRVGIGIFKAARRSLKSTGRRLAASHPTLSGAALHIRNALFKPIPGVSIPQIARDLRPFATQQARAAFGRTPLLNTSRRGATLPSRQPHLGLQSARNFCSKPALDVALNAPLGFRAAVQLLQDRHAMPSKNDVKRRKLAGPTPGNRAVSIGSIPSSLSGFDSFSHSDIFQRRKPEVEVRYTLLFQAKPTNIEHYDHFLSASFFDEKEFVHFTYGEHHRRIEEAVKKLQNYDMLAGDAIFIEDEGGHYLRVDINPKNTLLDVKQVLGFYDEDNWLFSTLDWKKIHEETEEWEDVNKEDESGCPSDSTETLGTEQAPSQHSHHWVMPRPETCSIQPLPFDSDLALSVADTVYSPTSSLSGSWSGLSRSSF